MDTDRKSLIADAALALLGSGGAKGLTHRAVDVEAGLPAGSTSFYCRTRLDLITLAMTRHAELDLADLQADAPQWLQSGDVERFITGLARRVHQWLAPERRGLLLARFELLMMASHEPSLQAHVRAKRAHFIELAAATLKHLGARQPQELALRLVTLIDGVLIGQISEGERRLTQAQCLMLLKAALPSDA